MISFTQSGSIRQKKRIFTDFHLFRHDIACCSGNIRHNTAVCTAKPVHNRGFSCIRTAKQNSADALTNDPAVLIIRCKLIQLLFDLIQTCRKRIAFELRRTFFCVIHPIGKCRHKINQTISNIGHLPSKIPVFCEIRLFQRCFTVRRYNIHDGLRLGQGHFTIHKGSFREFSGFCRLCTVPEQQTQNSLADIETAVTGYFNGIFTRKAVRCAEYCENNIVNAFAFVQDIAIGTGITRHL